MKRSSLGRSANVEWVLSRSKNEQTAGQDELNTYLRASLSGEAMLIRGVLELIWSEQSFEAMNDRSAE